MQKSQKSQVAICDSDKIKQRLKLLQDTLGITQEEMARLGGRKRVSYAEYVREHDPKMPGADFIANLVLNTGVNANWLLTGQGDVFNAASSAVETGMQEMWAVYQRLGEKERALLLEVARTFAGAKLQ
ncbi:MAG: XRE family transcriptional regulator [Caldilinea sp. CFX5]|nr:XRE family transcriptional regulator [Caldilinea sp. CFX5]